MLEKQRHSLLLDLLDEHQFLTVRTMSDQLNASEATIRRDISKLAKTNQLRKIRGGAEAIGNPTEMPKYSHLAGPAFWVDIEKHKNEKRLIAKKAVEICAETDAIIINGGTSTFMMGEFLVERNISVLTNSMYLANYLAENGSNQVTLPGGEVYRKQGLILSSFENDTIQYYAGKKMFMSAQGIGAEGIMEADPIIVRAEQKLMNRAEQVILLADSSKVGRSSNFIVCPLTKLDVLITDTGADPAILKKIENAGIKVILVSAKEEELANTDLEEY